MNSNLISRRKAINAVYGMTRPTGIDELPYEYAEGVISDLPSADIMECARAIKEYCNQFSKCEDCGCLNKNYCAFYTCPDEWNLPEGEKGGVECNN